MSVKRFVANGFASGMSLGKTAGMRFFKSGSDIPAITENLKKLAESLESECKAVEPAFMHLGGVIQAVYGDVTGLTAFTRDIVEKIGGNSEDAAVVQVKRIVEKSLRKLEKCRSGVSGNLATVNAIADRLCKLGTMVGEAEKIGMFLKVVSLNIQIESARSRASYEMFTLFSREVRDLSGKIIDVVNDIRNDSSEAFLSQKSAHAAITVDLARLDQLVAAGRSTVETASRDAERLVSISLDIVQKASEHTRKISEAVGEVVVGIQFHDSLSQRVDHIARAMEDAGKRCSQAAAQRQGTEEYAREMAAAHAIVSIQCAQLKRIISEIGSLYRMNRNALKHIGVEIDEVVQRLSDLNGADPVADRPGTQRMGDCFDNLQNGLSQLHGLIDQSETMMGRITAVAARATRVTRRLTAYAEVVGEVGYETHIKALNAIVNASHLRGDGKTLEILAQQIKTSSDRTDRFVTDVTGIIEAIASQERDAGLQSESTTENADQDLIAGFGEASADSGMNGILHIHENFSSGMATVFARADALKRAILDARNELGFLPELELRLSGLSEDLERIHEELAPWASDKSEEIGLLAERYTMEQERSVHEQVANVSTSAGEKSPGEAAGGLGTVSDENENEDLGDNVELF